MTAQHSPYSRRRSFDRPFTPREKPEFEEKVLDLARVTRVVAGGKRFRFRAVVAVGNRKGRVGVGSAKGSDVAQAVSKGTHQAKRNLVTVPLIKGTIPREITVKYNSARVYLKPAPKGRGINAGGAVRVISDLAGISDIIGKTLSRSGNKLNTARATVEAFRALALSSGRKSSPRETPSVEASTPVETPQKD
jgi:small subunit ribosomal protein S5